LRGSPEQLRAILDEARNMRISFEIVVVQPGISAARLSEGMKETLGATDEHLRSAGCAPFKIITSA
jgi:hypothetical protein